jgi:hypothetical protein
MTSVRKCFESKISKPTKLDCKQNFYCTVYYITLKSNCEAQRASKNLKKIVEDRVGSQKWGMSDLSVIFLLFEVRKICLKVTK